MSSHSPFSPPLHLLHLEDNPGDAELISAQIAEEWPHCKIKRVATRADFIHALHNEKFDLVLSDFSLPAFGGMEALTLVRQHDPVLPFLFLSGTIGEDNAVAALQRGATDYLIKDRPARLISAMRVALEKQHENQLRRSAEQKLREQAELLEKARDAICVTDIDGRISYYNHSAGELFGWTGEGGHGRHLLELFGPSNEALIAKALAELHTRGAWTGELQLSDSDGTLRYILTTWTLVRDARNEPKSILLINTDVTEQKKLELQLLRSQRLESIGTLAGGIAHDLNNVLTPILMAVNILYRELTDEGLLRLVEVLEKSARQGAGLIQQIMTFARGGQGERAELHLQLVIQDVVALLKETLPRTVTIEADVPRDLWPVLANPTQLGQVFMNLGVNARDAMGNGGQLRICARNFLVDESVAQAHPGSRSGPHILVTVADTGSGIPPELINRIFDPFFTTKAPGKGTGLGLATVLGIVKNHGGFLEVQSRPGRGTEFSLYFPAVPTQAEAPTGESSPLIPRGQGETILIIDDESSVREIARALLLAHGYRVLMAENGSAGLALYREHRDTVCAVLTDLVMPFMQGAEVVRELRLINSDVRIVAMSGGENSGAVEESDRLILLPKPMTGENLVRALQRVMAVG